MLLCFHLLNHDTILPKKIQKPFLKKKIKKNVTGQLVLSSLFFISTFMFVNLHFFSAATAVVAKNHRLRSKLIRKIIIFLDVS